MQKAVSLQLLVFLELVVQVAMEEMEALLVEAVLEQMVTVVTVVTVVLERTLLLVDF
jgi:hypothetical protein